MIFAVVIGMGVILALLPSLSSLGPYGIVVCFLLASTLSLFFNQMVSLIVRTAETLENKR